MKKQIYIYKDENNSIVLSKDHYHGVVIQVIRFVDQLVRTQDNLLICHKNHNVVHEVVIKVSPTIREEVAAAIAKSRLVIDEIKNKDNQIDGLINDYHSMHRDLNEPEQQ
jgi:hypothetical protein